MRKAFHLIILCTALLALAACQGDKATRHLPHLGNTPYQQDTILVAYATDPERALSLLDSALRLGNISDYRARFIRAKIYSKSLMEQRQDSAIAICKSLLSHDSVRNEPTEQENILDLLIASSRARHDDELYLHWATQKAKLCQEQGEETERWRTEADIGLVLTFLGQVDEGLAKLNEAIGRLDAPGSIDRMDAFTIAVKRKINALEELGRFAEVVPLAQRTLDRLKHYERHALDYAEDSYRLSWSDSPSDRDRYIDFSRAQAWGFMARAYAQTDSLQKAKEYLALFDNTGYGHTFAARRMIAPTQMALGMYDEALATYDEMARRLATDTLNDDYAVILHSRAIAARAKGHVAEAYDYQTRYASLSKTLSDSLHRSKAHDYAARYHAQEQQLLIQEKQAEAERSHIVSIAVAFIALLAIAFALYFLRQKRIVSEKNRALVRMINGTPPALEDEEVEEDEEEVDEIAEEKTMPTPTPGSETAAPGTTLPHCEATGAGDALFASIDATIRTERLYSDNALQRQDICDRFRLRRHTLNELLAEHTDGLSFPQYINDIRTQEALRLLREEPQKNIAAIADAVGFTPANMREQFKRKFGITPAEYRQNL